MIESRVLKIGVILSMVAVTCLALSSFADEPEKDYSDLYRALQVRDEPSLLSQCEGGYEALRFFEFSDQGPAGVARIERLGDELVHTVRTYNKDNRSQTSKRSVAEKDWQDLLELLEPGGYTNTEAMPELWIPKGRTWLFETCFAGHYESMRAYPDRDLRMQDVVNALIDLKF